MSSTVTWLLHGSLAFILAGLGAELTRDDFTRQRRLAPVLLAGLVGGPLLAVALAAALSLEAPLALGLVLLGAMPAGPLGAAWARLVRGDVARALALVAVTTLASLGTAPVALWLTRHAAPPVAFGPALRVLATVVAAVAAGLTLRARRPAVAARLAVVARRGAVVVLVVAVALVFTAERARLFEALPRVGLATLVFNLAQLGVGALLGGRTAALALSVRNGTIALAVAPLLGEVTVALPVVVYAALQTCTSAALVLALGRSHPGGNDGTGAA